MSALLYFFVRLFHFDHSEKALHLFRIDHLTLGIENEWQLATFHLHRIPWRIDLQIASRKLPGMVSAFLKPIDRYILGFQTEWMHRVDSDMASICGKRHPRNIKPPIEQHSSCKGKPQKCNS